MFYSGISDIGMKRSTNQDSFTVKQYRCGAVLGVVCDGMGGIGGGQVASKIAVENFVKSIDMLMEPLRKNARSPHEAIIAETLNDGVCLANAAVLETASDNPELYGMGTTLVASLIIGNRIYTVNVGDSRMYLADSDKIVQITHDHSYVQYLVDIGKMTKREAETSANKNIITRAVGTEEVIEPDIYLTEIKDTLAEGSDIHIVLCSDGLTNHVSPDSIYGMIKNSETDGEGVRALAEKLIKEANRSGGSDNITVVVIALSTQTNQTER